LRYQTLIADELQSKTPQRVAELHSDQIREKISNWLALDELQPEIFLTPSGTDIELLVLAMVAGMQSRPLVNIVVGPEEIGGGSKLAAAGCHYSSELASGGEVGV